MTFTKESTLKSGDDVEKVIDKAIKKVRAHKENDLCKFLPGPKGGYMHHFTLRKIKHSDPKKYASLIQEFIIDKERPIALDPKPRAPRGSRKRKDIVSFSRTDIERVIDLARKAGDKELLSKFSPKRPLPVLKRELIRSIREERVNHELWNSYAEAIAATKGSI